MIARLICLIRGHRRGNRIPSATAGSGFNEFQCPRCLAKWTRKARETAPA